MGGCAGVDVGARVRVWVYQIQGVLSVPVAGIIWFLGLCCHNNYFPLLCVCPDITTATGELHVFDFDLDKEDRCSVADKLWDSL